MAKGNKGEWSEPYAAIRIIGEKKLYLADQDDNINLNEWMDIIELIRHETSDRIVKYKYQTDNTMVDIYVNDTLTISIEADCFLEFADIFANEIVNGHGNSFCISDALNHFLDEIQIKHMKALNIEKSDVFLSIRDPRASIVRNHIGFSIKSAFGKDPTLFNTAKASATLYEVTGMTDDLMNEINNMYDSRGNVAVCERCDKLIASDCNLKFIGYPVAIRARCAAFEENLDLLDARLKIVIERMLWNHFINHYASVDISDVIQKIIEDNPCELSRPEVKYPYMMKTFLYAAYCGMTASKLWNGNSQVNGGMIKVKRNGEVIAYYALESDLFKTYLYKNCYLEFPSTDSDYGDYAKVYKENGKYYFKLNFQIRYRV